MDVCRHRRLRTELVLRKATPRFGSSANGVDARLENPIPKADHDPCIFYCSLLVCFGGSFVTNCVFWHCQVRHHGNAAPREGAYDNNNPRSWLARQTDWRARANAAQANTFEALPFFFAAVIIAHQLQASQARLHILALLFVVLRIAYIMMYVGNLANARSIIWALAFFINIGILFTGFR